MKEDIAKILENDGLLLKAFGVLIVLSFWLAPGAIFLLVEKTNVYFKMEFSKLVFTSFILSMPFNIVGFIMVSASFMSNKNTSEMPMAFNVWAVIIISCLWGCLNVGVMYINTRLPFNPTNYYLDLSYNENYVVNFVAMTTFMLFVLAKFVRRKRQEC